MFVLLSKNTGSGSVLEIRGEFTWKFVQPGSQTGRQTEGDVERCGKSFVEHLQVAGVVVGLPPPCEDGPES